MLWSVVISATYHILVWWAPPVGLSSGAMEIFLSMLTLFCSLTDSMRKPTYISIVDENERIVRMTGSHNNNAHGIIFLAKIYNEEV